MRCEPLMHIDNKSQQQRMLIYDQLDDLLSRAAVYFTNEELYQLLTARAADYAPETD